MNSGRTQGVVSEVWPWREPRAAEPTARDRARARRRRALLQASLAAAVATVMTAWRGHVWMGGVLYALSAWLAGSAFLAPRAFDAFERGGRALAAGVGQALTWALLVPFFFLCFAPGRLILRLAGRDPMKRRADADRPSYWMPHAPARGASSYSRQY